MISKFKWFLIGLTAIPAAYAITDRTINAVNVYTTNLRASAMTTAGPVKTDASGNISSEAQLAVSRGGTGIASGNSGGVPYFSAAGTIASSNALTANQVVIGGGAGAAPSALAAGSQYQVLTMGASDPGYGAVNLAQSAAVTGALGATNGGTGQSTYTTGDTLYSSASNTLSKLSIGNAHEHLSVTAAGIPGWTAFYNRSAVTEWFDDFTGGGNTGSGYLNLSGQSGTGASAGFTYSQDVGHMGVVRFSTGTTTTGYAYHASDVFAIFGASGATHDLEWLVYLPALSDGTDTYQLWMGYGNVYNGTQPTNGVYFGYTHGTNSGNFTLNATKASATTTTNASSGPIASAWNKFRININSDASTATFYHNGVSLGTVTTNIPVTVNTHKTGIQLSILKSAGTNDRICYLDYVGYRAVYNTAR